MKLKTTPSTSMAGDDVESSDREHLRPLKLRLIAEMMRLCGINYVSVRGESYDIEETTYIPASVKAPDSAIPRVWPGQEVMRSRYSRTIVMMMEQLKLFEARFEYGPAGEQAEWTEFWDYIVIGHGDEAQGVDVAAPVPAKAAPVLDKVPYDTLAACTPIIGVDYTVADHQLAAQTDLGRFMRPYIATKLRQAGYALNK